MCRSAALLSSVVSPERSEGTRSTIGGLCFLVFSSSAVRRVATPDRDQRSPLLCPLCGRCGACVSTPRNAERSEAFHDSKYLLSRQSDCVSLSRGGGWWRRRRLLVDSACASRSDASSDSKYLLSR